MDVFAQMQQRYRDGTLPWDQPLPPPEVVALTDHLPPGRALDLGCGAGRTSIYLAQHGWTCDGVDFVPEAIQLARTRAEAAGVAGQTRFIVSPVTQLADVQAPYDLAIDIGCMHNMRGPDAARYAAEVARVLRPGGVYLLFAHLSGDPAVESQFGMSEQFILDLFAEYMVLERIERGTTTVGESVWPSAWFWMRRQPVGDSA